MGGRGGVVTGLLYRRGGSGALVTLAGAGGAGDGGHTAVHQGGEVHAKEGKEAACGGDQVEGHVQLEEGGEEGGGAVMGGGGEGHIEEDGQAYEEGERPGQEGEGQTASSVQVCRGKEGDSRVQGGGQAEEG